MINIRLVISLSVFILLAFSCLAGSEERYATLIGLNERLNQYKCDVWSKADGVPANILIEIEQSPDGYLWITSYDGIIRFDGIKFELFNKARLGVDEQIVSSSICRDQDDVLWIGTENAGLFTYKDGVLAKYDLDTDFRYRIIEVYADRFNRIWISTLNSGIFILDGRKVLKFAADEIPDQYFVNAFAESSDGFLWLGTEGGGIYRWNGQTLRHFTTQEGLPSNSINRIMTDSKDRIWAATDEGLAWFEGDRFTLVEQTRALPSQGLAADNEGNIWSICNFRISRYSPASDRFEQLDRDVKHSYILSAELFIDRERNIWVTTQSGDLVRYRKASFARLSTADGLEGETFFSVARMNSGKIMAASVDGYLDLIESYRATPYPVNVDLANVRIRHVMQDSRDRLYISTYSGLYVLKDGRLLRHHCEQNGFPDDQVRLSFETHDGRLLVGTRRRGLIEIDAEGDGHKILVPDEGLRNALVMSIQQDRSKTLWIGTSGQGLFAVRQNGTVSQYKAVDGLVSDIVFNTYTDKDDCTWVACNGGLCMVCNGTVHAFTDENGLTSNSVYDVAEDNKGFLWMPCNNSILRADKSSLLAVVEGTVDKVDTVLFDEDQGFTSIFSPTGRILKTTDGLLIFPTINGVAVINPDRIEFNPFEPLCDIPRVTVGTTEFSPASEEITVQPDARRIRFDFTALSLVAPEKIKFQYRLEGFDELWSAETMERSASFTNLPPGKYSFLVRARNHDGQWSPNPAVVIFRVLPNVYQQLWFRVVVFFVATAAVAIFFQLRFSYLKKQKVELEQVIQDRTREIQEQARALREKNEELEAFSYTLSHDLRSPLRHVKGFSDVLLSECDFTGKAAELDAVNRIQTAVIRMERLIEDVLALAKISRTVMVMTDINISRLAKSVINGLRLEHPQRKIESRIEDNIVVNSDLGLMQILFENLIGNAWKYSGKEEVTILEFGKTVARGKEAYFIRDNGVGFDQSRQENLFVPFQRLHDTREFEGTGIGLATAQRIVHRLGGEIWAEAEIGKGATFYFTLG